MKFRNWVLWVVTGSSACAPYLPHATPQDAWVARERYPEVSEEKLEAGRRTYVTKCAGCHGLWHPDRYDAAEWGRQVADMAQDAKLKEEDQDAVVLYLAVMSDLARGSLVRTSTTG